MPKTLLKRIISFVLFLVMMLSLSSSLIGCSMASDSDGNFDGAEDSGDNGSTEAPDDSEAEEDSGSYKDKIIVPPYKEYDRNTVNFAEITYSRPDFASAIGAFESVIALIKENTASFDEQIAAIVELEDVYSNVLTMYAFANIYNSKDSSIIYWNEEYAYVTGNYPAFVGKVEDMFVAAANSPHAERFEDEYFGDGLIEDYKDGGIYTDNMIKLWEDEEALEAEYSSLSTATVEITYNGMTDTVDNIINHYLDKYGETSTSFTQAYSICMAEYQTKLDELSGDILISLFKVRKLIADELGNETYLEHAYKSHGRDYSGDEMSKLLDDISKYVLPVYSQLNYYVFYYYFQSNTPSKTTLDKLINNSYKLMGTVDEELSDIFAYMLQYELYDIELSSVNRQSGAFTTYLNDFDAPFVFLSAGGTVKDYSTLIHEFGHFADAFINYDSSTSIDQKEVSSQGLELLLLHYMNGTLAESDIKYLKYTAMCNALETLIFQGFYARFEQLAYAIPYDRINKENLDAAILTAAEEFGLNTEYVKDISVAYIPHIFLYPFYVQSYCTSIIPALQLYFLEDEQKGKGIEAYKMIVDRTDSDLDFTETLESAGLDSVFSADILRDIADCIYYEIVGSHYYGSGADDESAA